MEKFSGIPFVEFPKSNAISGNEAEGIDAVLSMAGLEGYQRKKAEMTFKNSDLFNALPQEWKNDPALLATYIKNSFLFDSIIHLERTKAWSGETEGLLTEKVVADEGVRANGSKRRTESGYRLNIEYLRSKGIDAHKVLFYRRTQPGEEVKPELYWTSDFSEVASGLTAEIGSGQRNSSIVLVVDLEKLDTIGGGLIQDINDDSGISVRTISSKGVDQKEALFSIKNPTS